MIPEIAEYTKLSIKQKILIGSLCAIVAIFTIAVIAISVYTKKGYNLDIGSVSPRRFDAESTFENKYAMEKKREEVIKNVLPVYASDKSAQEKSAQNLNDFFSFIEEYKKVKSNSPYLMSKIAYESIKNRKNDEKTFSLSEEQLNVIDSMDTNEYNKFKNAIFNVFDMLKMREIKTENDVPIFIQDCMDEAFTEFSQKQYSFASYILNCVVIPNCIIDIDATEIAKKQKADSIEPIMILKNQKIIDEGEIIDEEILSLLKSMGYVNDNNVLFNNIPQILGLSIIIAIVFICMIFVLRKYLFKGYNNPKRLYVVFTLYMGLLISSIFLRNFHYTISPILIFTLLVSLMVNIKTAISLNVAVSVICCFMYGGNIDFLLYFLAMGTIISVAAKYSVERTQLMYSIVAVVFFSVFAIVGITLMNDTYWKDNLFINALYAFFSTGLSYIIALGSLPLFESIFGIVTNVKLLELINPNKELLRKLLIEAPGTYHHSLIVANLAEAGCSKIKANEVLARVGAYYHDIGKLKKPHYFTENIIGNNPHDNFEPKVSANIIINHIKDGLELADKYKLPDVVKKIIRQHHGTTTVRFFYHKAKTFYGEDKIKKSDYCYNYDLPDTKEAAIVMLADSCEASVRSVMATGKTMEDVEKIIDKIIKDKTDEQQFINCNLSFKELYAVKGAFMEIFNGMYHKRIQYPEEDKKEE